MKNSVFVGILFGLMLIGMMGFVSGEENSTCIDSDGGNNIYKYGEVTMGPGKLEQDYCINSNNLRERWCSDNSLEFKDYACSSGCKNGACLSESNVTSPNSTTSSVEGCKNLYWFDSNLKNCGYKKFCGAYMYQGLRTFEIKDKCEKKLKDEKKEKEENETDEDDETETDEDDKDKIQDKVTCNFLNSDKKEKCYLGKGAGLHEGISCSGVGSCVIEVNGKKGGEITWKSSCGGYQYTKQDGNDDTIEFDCSVGESNITVLKRNGVRYAYWQCYDGKEQKAGDENSCYVSDNFQAKAKEDCKEHCKGEKCGVNSFSVGGNCYIEDFAGTIDAEDFEDIKNSNISDFKADLICKNSCALDGKCYPFGYRKSGNYCTDKGSFENQIGDNEKCDNNFECSSNVCVSGKCLSQGLIEKILSWFKNLFG